MPGLRREEIAGLSTDYYARREGDRPRDPAAARVVAELSAESDFFRTVWSDRTVVAGSRPVKRFQHAVAGTIDMTVETLEVAGAPGQRLVVMTPAPADEPAWAEVARRR